MLFGCCSNLCLKEGNNLSSCLKYINGVYNNDLEDK